MKEKKETWIRSLGQEGPLKKSMATTHSSILAWRNPCTEEPGWATVNRVVGLQRVGCDWSNLVCMHSLMQNNYFSFRDFTLLRENKSTLQWLLFFLIFSMSWTCTSSRYFLLVEVTHFFLLQRFWVIMKLPENAHFLKHLPHIPSKLYYILKFWTE